MLLLPSSFLSILSWKLQDHSDSWSLIWELFCFFFGQLQYLLFMHSVQEISLCYVQICESVFIHCTGRLVGPFKIKTCLFFSFNSQNWNFWITLKAPFVVLFFLFGTCIILMLTFWTKPLMLFFSSAIFHVLFFFFLLHFLLLSF